MLSSIQSWLNNDKANYNYVNTIYPFIHPITIIMYYIIMYCTCTSEAGR